MFTTMRDRRRIRPPKGFPAELGPYRYYYDMRREPGYEDLENRLVVDWVKGTIAYIQWLSNKEVIELLPSGQTLPPFRDYLKFTLSHAELRDLYENEDANREWRSRLAAVAGSLFGSGNQIGGAVCRVCLRCERHLGPVGRICSKRSRGQQPAQRSYSQRPSVPRSVLILNLTNPPEDLRTEGGNSIRAALQREAWEPHTGLNT